MVFLLILQNMRCNSGASKYYFTLRSAFITAGKEGGNPW